MENKTLEWKLQNLDQIEKDIDRIHVGILLTCRNIRKAMNQIIKRENELYKIQKWKIELARKRLE